jgi:hypothetical protein
MNCSLCRGENTGKKCWDPVMVPLCSLFSRWIEQPGIQLGKWLITRRPKSTDAANQHAPTKVSIEQS